MENTHEQTANGNGNPKPDLIARVREGHGKNVSFETVGVAWTRDDGSIYFKPYGKQIIENPVYLFKNKTEQPEENNQ